MACGMGSLVKCGDFISMVMKPLAFSLVGRVSEGKLPNNARSWLSSRGESTIVTSFFWILFTYITYNYLEIYYN